MDRPIPIPSPPVDKTSYILSTPTNTPQHLSFDDLDDLFNSLIPPDPLKPASPSSTLSSEAAWREESPDLSPFVSPTNQLAETTTVTVKEYRPSLPLAITSPYLRDELSFSLLQQSPTSLQSFSSSPQSTTSFPPQTHSATATQQPSLLFFPQTSDSLPNVEHMYISNDATWVYPGTVQPPSTFFPPAGVTWTTTRYLTLMRILRETATETATVTATEFATKTATTLGTTTVTEQATKTVTTDVFMADAPEFLNQASSTCAANLINRMVNGTGGDFPLDFVALKIGNQSCTAVPALPPMPANFDLRWMLASAVVGAGTVLGAQYLYRRYHTIPVPEGEDPSAWRRFMKGVGFHFGKKVQKNPELGRLVEMEAVKLQERDIQAELNAEGTVEVEQGLLTTPLRKAPTAGTTKAEQVSSSLRRSFATPTMPRQRTPRTGDPRCEAYHEALASVEKQYNFVRDNVDERTPDELKRNVIDSIEHARFLLDGDNHTPIIDKKRKSIDAELDDDSDETIHPTAAPQNSAVLDLNKVPELRPRKPRPVKESPNKRRSPYKQHR